MLEISALYSSSGFSFSHPRSLVNKFSGHGTAAAVLTEFGSDQPLSSLRVCHAAISIWILCPDCFLLWSLCICFDMSACMEAVLCYRDVIAACPFCKWTYGVLLQAESEWKGGRRIRTTNTRSCHLSSQRSAQYPVMVTSSYVGTRFSTIELRHQNQGHACIS